MKHKSDQITRKGLERIREYCRDHNSCCDCMIRQQCDEFCNDLITSHPIPYPVYWTDNDISNILKTTRNYMEAIFIRSLEEIIEQGGMCRGIRCKQCPFDNKFQENGDFCPQNELRKGGHVKEKIEIAEMLLEYYKGEIE